MQITSRHNHLLQQVRRAHSSGKPMPDGLIVAEGPHLLQEALREHPHSWTVTSVLATASGLDRLSHVPRNVEIIEVSEEAFASVVTTEHTQGVLSLLRPHSFEWPGLLGQTPLVLILDGIQDPGNAGTLIRSAEAFGATGVVFTLGSVRVSNGKLLRASAGSMLRLPYIESVSSDDTIAFAARSLHLYAMNAKGKQTIHDIDLRKPCAFITGSEGCGIAPVLEAAATSVKIPTGRVESLNAAVAASIALFEAARQRGLP